MTEFHHWDFVDEFTAEEAAALILGIDPGNLNETERRKLKPVISCMYDCYQNALSYYIDDIDPQKEPMKEMLASSTMSSALDSGIEPETWPKRKEITDFEQQKFTRKALDDWLKEKGLKSQYQFMQEQGQPIPTPEQNGHWPWGNHSTELLEHLEAAAKKFWANYKNDHSSAPLNKTVVSWLTEERNVTGSMAKAIATILRADGIPTGPRKNL